TALDVGQGGAVVLETARHVLLFDTGPRHGDASDAGTALDVGQGGAVVLETARHVLLFDTGPRHGDASD
ncbi:hypothetical protein CKW47_21545, partial [Bordetella pertussis]